MEETKMVKLKMDGIDIEVPAGTTLMEAAKKIGVKVPSLCYHPYLSIEGACRVCIVEIKGMKDFVASCAYPVAEGMEVVTHTPDIRQARRDIVELLLDNHPDECHTCERDHNCELQRLAYSMGLRHKHFKGEKKKYEKDFSSNAVVRDPEKCILCGRCVRVCQEIQGTCAIDMAHRGFKSTVVPAYEKPFGESVCSSCGQCINVCPTAAFLEKDYTNQVWEALNDPNKLKVVQFAPSVRAAIGEGFGLPVGQNMEKKTITALRRLGFDMVFDTQFAADLTIVEEATELIDRISNGGKLPMITSCSAAWIKFCEQFYPELLDNLSSCMSPMSMLGSILKRYLPQKLDKDPAQVYSVAAMCCTAKKDESMRDEMQTEDGHRYVDAVITTRELIWMIKSAGIDFNSLEEGEFDSPLGESTGAATIFGATGGVMEAAVRTAHYFITGQELPGIELKAVRGAIDGIKEAEVQIADKTIKVAVASSLGHAQTLLEKVRAGEEYHFIEIMGCLGGCIGGGGQPYAGTDMIPLDKELLKKRAQALYSSDERNEKRRSHENEDIKNLYESALEKYGSHVAHEWLHTHYSAKLPQGICREGKSEQQRSCIVPEDPRFQELAVLMEGVQNEKYQKSYLIPVLHRAQELFGYLSDEVMNFVSLKMQIPTSRIYGVATFYHFFSLKPKGEVKVNVCLGTACYVKGAGDVVRETERELGIKMGDTTKDGKFSLECTRCIGACGLAPVVLVNDKVYSKVTPKQIKGIIKEYR
ncbi:MAG: ferredoxin [Candidatus Margulisiibacteriota bacterium]|nr:MAG: hypothetical protein A2X43_11750 [Candidatus Margulisbacteria bacterium GWD2_39_127]OGI01814.1 MAG: hypothetical protein A2X42_04275 [Candidatus Margulisbacteria bacterium GWF2_38_17]PZM79527.1 MAG: ferredoxin [Candidatus Margulisiibacteriota bacterium]HAR63800.1 ferredoxin [Candidatus Margulisiibacteriota bacterium]HCY37798.1 ferredoxin [Candidatus Margulisiibacteriota bacterium]